LSLSEQTEQQRSQNTARNNGFQWQRREIRMIMHEHHSSVTILAQWYNRIKTRKKNLPKTGRLQLTTTQNDAGEIKRKYDVVNFPTNFTNKTLCQTQLTHTYARTHADAHTKPQRTNVA